MEGQFFVAAFLLRNILLYWKMTDNPYELQRWKMDKESRNYMKESLQVMTVRDIPYSFVISPELRENEEKVFETVKVRFSSEDLQEAYLVIGKKMMSEAYSIAELDQIREPLSGEYVVVISEGERQERVYGYMQYIAERGGTVQGFTVL